MHLSAPGPEIRPSGLPAVGEVAWGTHLCHFFRERADLLDILVPFFKAGLEANERCLWITAEPLLAADATEALRHTLPDLDERMQRGQIEILDYHEWYLRSERMSADEVIHSWLAREAAARESGFDGLRVSGNTFWLDHEDWDDFVAYEAGVHRVFHSQRIIALCSYSLNKCTVNDIVDVVRNHRFALTRRDGQWQSIQSATEMLAAIDTGLLSVPARAGTGQPTDTASPAHSAPVASHSARFFRESDYPATQIAEYLQHSLAEGGAALVFATKAHGEAIASALRTLGWNLGVLLEKHQLVIRDAAELARAIVVERVPDAARFRAHVGEELERALAKFGHVRAYGEIVNVLAQMNDRASAIQLEQWWNQLLHGKAAALLCGYALDSFSDVDSIAAFRRVCGEHAHVHAADNAEDENDGRLAAALEQATAALNTESHERQQALREQERLREAERASRLEAQSLNRHLATLQRLTSAMSEATTLSEIGHAVVSGLEKVFHADVAALVVTLPEDDTLLLVGRTGMNTEQARRFAAETSTAPRPLAGACRSRHPIWLNSPAEIAKGYPAVLEDMPEARSVGCVPLLRRDRCVGAIEVRYNGKRKHDAAQRALLEDYVGQIALAVERGLTYENAQRTGTRLQLLADAGRRIGQAKLNLEQVMETVVHEVARAGFADCSAISLRDETRETLSLVALHHVDAEHCAAAERLLRATPVLVGEGVVGTVAQTGRSMRITSCDEVLRRFRFAYREYLEKYPISSMVAVPLRASGEVIGTLTASRDYPSVPFTAEDEELLQELADRAALSIENALLYERAKNERERAEAANAAKDEFLAMLGHELRNPLSPILTAAQLMRLRGGDLLVKERTTIERQVHHMVRLVDDLLDVSRITRGKIALKRTPTELVQVVADALEIASPLLEERRHRVVTSLPSSGLLVEADASRLAQVIANLLTNAAKYTPPEGTVEVTATTRGDKVDLRVSDNGVGIEPTLLPRIFNLFAQGKQASDRAQGGLGLGLTIARKLTEMHGGTLRARSDGPGKGAEFTVELSLLTPRDTAVAAVATPAVATTSGRKILLVDDNTDAADSLSEALQMFGHDVQVAYDGPSALRVAEEFCPDLALLDIGLPAMDGYELGQRLKSAPGTAALKLVALTGYGLQSDRHRSAEAGFHSHLVKPVDFERLQAIIEELLPASLQD